MRQVYRLLKQKDLRKDLAGQEVSVGGPEPTAYLHYPDTDEYEDVQLSELVESKQIAVSGAGANGSAAAADSDMAEAEAFRNSLINALMHSFSGPGPAGGMIPTPGGAMIPTPGSGGTIMIPTPGGAGEPPGSARGPGSGRGERSSSLKHQGSLTNAGDEEVRSKVREQLVGPLQKAMDELKAEGYTEALPAPAAVAAEVELELFRLHGNSVSKDYKAKFRSLAFNLKDTGNPELRARVLRGELAPSTLVTLGPAELARKELSAWRQKRQEEAAKMVFLDAETAAKFSTAAAAALAQSRIRGKDEEGPNAKPATSPEHDLAAAAKAVNDAAAAADAAAVAAANGNEGAAPAAAGDGSHRRVSSGLPRMDSGVGSHGTASASGATGEGAGVDLLQRPSVTSIPGGPNGGGSAATALPAAAAVAPAAAPAPSPVKRTVLRAALPAAPVAGDETPPRADQEGDVPYDPERYDEPYDPEQQMPDEGDVPKYEPIDPAAAGAPSVASLRAAPAAVLPVDAERQGSLPSPVRSPPAASAASVVADLVPVVSRQQAGEGPLSELPPDNVGEPLWTGVLRVPGPTGELVAAVEVSYLGGSGRLGPMLRCGEPAGELLVKGQVKLSRVEQFFEELRRSRSRTITLALVRQLAGPQAAAVGLSEAAAAAEACGGLAEFAAQHRSRTGLATPGSGLEAYLVARGGLAARLLKTARAVCLSHQLALLPGDIGEDQVLLAMVHPRAWEPAPHMMATAMNPQPQHHQHGHHHQGGDPTSGLPSPAGAAPLGGPLADPRRRGGPAAAPGPMDVPPPQPQMPPPLHAGVPPPMGGPPAADGAAGAGPIDLGALSDLAAALGIPGGGPPAPAPAPEQAVAPVGPDGGMPQQVMTMVMQNPDGSLTVVALPPGPPPPGAGGPPAHMVLQPQAMPAPGPAPGPGGMPGPGPEHPPSFAPQGPGGYPGPHSYPPEQGGPPAYLSPGGPPGPGMPYQEPPQQEHYGGHGPPPPGRYPQGPPGPGGPRGGPPGPYHEPPPPYMDPRADPRADLRGEPRQDPRHDPRADPRTGPPPPHQGGFPPRQHSDPFYGGPAPGGPHHYRPPPGPEYPPGEPYGPPRDGPDGRPPPYYPPRDRDRPDAPACDEVLSELLSTSPLEGARVVGLMDEMSDQLCRAYDAAECCRNVHSDPAWRQAASRACVQLGAYIARVNHHEGLYSLLAAALDAYEDSMEALDRRETPPLSPHQLAGWCRETVLVAQRLKQDMEQAGIHLPPEQRERMAALSAANGHFAAEFNAALTDPARVGRLRLGGGRQLVLDPGSVGSVLASEPHESVRRQVYLAAGSSPECNARLLSDMIAVRRDMARMQALAELKAFDSRSGPSASASSPVPLSAWDVEYYAARARREASRTPPGALLRYTALPSLLAGLRELLGRLFRLRLAVSEAAPGEGWAAGVLRCDASHPELGPLGTIYLDLGDRPGKYPSAVTFPITCGRQLPGPPPSPASPAAAPEPGPAPDGYRQLPVLALLACASGRCPATGQPALSWRELRVLLHELGHCVHSLLSRTKYQHLWGTRCAQDLVEVPSHLFEYFAADPRVMALLARDRSGCAKGADGGPDDGEPLPPELLRELLAGRAATSALELQQQLVLSLADQLFFGEQPPGGGEGGGEGGQADGGLSTGDTWRQAVDLASSVPHVPGTRPELRVGHLTIYGGSYYSYVYARCLAAQLWRSTGLEEAPLDPGAGDLLRDRLLGPGGAVEPLQLMAGLAEGAAARAAAPGRRLRSLYGQPGGQGGQPPQQQMAESLQRGLRAALGPGGLLQELEGGFAPQPERYLEALQAGRAA
ncbi:hypothetical protein GPECTOR_5g423 [Gonium pectorale]|uniref:TFIIS central domain-containing protein n=1 Tax=Gonium pectorale TaxID=33097 RepID=A0A150GWW2_GONPE|nr:hypothetical protein GPECTOR_5g423 [Gonium pectorale]|eukprot:KXZ54341.1 hypothetical protein GPECTOR_5g423 [Gonium pectorale]